MENFGFCAMSPKIDKRDYRLAAGAVKEKIFPAQYSLDMGEIKKIKE